MKITTCKRKIRLATLYFKRQKYKKNIELHPQECYTDMRNGQTQTVFINRSNKNVFLVFK